MPHCASWVLGKLLSSSATIGSSTAPPGRGGGGKSCAAGVAGEDVLVPSGPLVIGVDETLQRRWGKKIAAKGVYRDPLRSTHDRFVKASGLRWVCLMLLWCLCPGRDASGHCRS